MALTHLLDTSVLTLLTDLEIGFSARNAPEWDRLTSAVSAFSLVETTDQHLRRARAVQRALASTSQRGRKVSDLLVAAAAEDAGLTLLHYDADFDIIAGATGQPAEWVVPRGSVS